MVMAKNRKSKPATARYVKLVNDIYVRFENKASEIGAKNVQAFESAFKKLDYLEINQLLHYLSQLKIAR